MARASDNPFPSVLLVEGAAPTGPAAGRQRLFFDVADHQLKRVASDGTVAPVGAVSGIQPTIVDAKGDLLGATAADTPARVPVGADGQVLTADAAQALGVKWATPAAAGGGGVARFVDTFDTDTTGSYTKDAGVAGTDFTVTGGVLRILGGSHAVRLKPPGFSGGLPNFIAVVDFVLPARPSATLFAVAIMRARGGQHGAGVVVQGNNAGTIDVGPIRRDAAGAVTWISATNGPTPLVAAGAASATAGTRLWLRVALLGTAIEGTLWNVDPETDAAIGAAALGRVTADVLTTTGAGDANNYGVGATSNAQPQLRATSNENALDVNELRVIPA